MCHGYRNAFDTLSTELSGQKASMGSGRPAASPESGPEELYRPAYYHHGLWTDPAVIHNHDSLRDPRYIEAFKAGKAALQTEHEVYWRLHVALYFAARGSIFSIPSKDSSRTG